MSKADRFLKRTFDIIASAVGLVLVGWLIIAAAILARIDTGSNGFFVQTRIGRNGKPFRLVKIRTMVPSSNLQTTVTHRNDPRITSLGASLRRFKIDELPQLYNILVGDMSFVGPRPDVPGFADELEGDERLILSVRPGLTGPATMRFRDEEELLAEQPDPEAYNRKVIYPEKVRLNLDYIRHYSFAADLRWIMFTIFNRRDSNWQSRE